MAPRYKLHRDYVYYIIYITIISILPLLVIYIRTPTHILLILSSPLTLSIACYWY